MDVEYISPHRYIKNIPDVQADTMHIRHRSACRTPAESRQEYLTSRKEYIDPSKLEIKP